MPILPADTRKLPAWARQRAPWPHLASQPSCMAKAQTQVFLTLAKCINASVAMFLVSIFPYDDLLVSAGCAGDMSLQGGRGRFLDPGLSAHGDTDGDCL